MSALTQRQLDRLLRQTQPSDQQKNGENADDVVNYSARPSWIRTEGYLSPPPDSQYGLVSPLTEVSRVTSPVTILDATGDWSVTVDVATQITMTDANGTTIIFNYAAP